MVACWGSGRMRRLLSRRGTISKPITVPSGEFFVVPPFGPFTTLNAEQFFRDGDGLLTEKLFIDFTPTTGPNTAGIGNMRWPYVGASTGDWILRDCKVRNVSAIPPRIRDGTGEAGFWIGEKCIGSRLESWNSAWMEMFTGAACAGSRFDNVNLHDNPHVALYMEHVTTDVEFTNCNFGGPTAAGGNVATDSSSINVEWWYMDGAYGPSLPYGGRAGSYNCKFIDCEIYCPPTSHPLVKGAFLDAGTYGFQFIRCRFYGPGNALGFPNNRMLPSSPNVATDCIFDNAGSQITFHDNVIGN